MGHVVSGKNVTITVVVQQVSDLEASREHIARIRAALDKSGVRDLTVYVNDPHEPNTGPWG